MHPIGGFIHHIPLVLGNLIPGSDICGIQWIQYFIMGFFMTAFFVATGRCTNFQFRLNNSYGKT